MTDGLKGMPEALAAVFPATTLQTCIVHLIRNSLDYASWKDRRRWLPRFGRSTQPRARSRTGDARSVCRRPWGQRYPTVSAAWRTPGIA
ncbi:transposase (fragment) [Ralstonia solanacearum CFBP2957]